MNEIESSQNYKPFDDRWYVTLRAHESNRPSPFDRFTIHGEPRLNETKTLALYRSHLLIFNLQGRVCETLSSKKLGWCTYYLILWIENRWLDDFIITLESPPPLSLSLFN